MMRAETLKRPVVFIGPSIPLAVATRMLPHADYRPPIRRGDLDGIPPGSLVGIIDGLFAQTLAISPGEIRAAIARGVTVYGAASMGALRAAEIPTMVGVGRVFEMYHSGALERDDEVALLFDPRTCCPFTEPLVNIRYAVDRLVRSGTLNRDTGCLLIEAATKLHYTERTYEAIFARSSLAHKCDADDIIKLLRGFNLKRDDAQFLLETLAEIKTQVSTMSSSLVHGAGQPVGTANNSVQISLKSDDRILIWESGDLVNFNRLIRFLKFTGRFEQFARNAISRCAIAGSAMRMGEIEPTGVEQGNGKISAQSVLDATRLIWGWESPEEAHVTMADLGLSLMDIGPALEAEATATRVVSGFASSKSDAFAKALRTELWLNDLALKREAMREGAIQFFARRGAVGGPPTDMEVDDAKRSISRLMLTMQWPLAESDLRRLGVLNGEISEIVRDFALARRAARTVIEAMGGARPVQCLAKRAADWRILGVAMAHSIKAQESNRFSLSSTEACANAESIAKQIGIVRIGQIGELDTLGIHVAQAFGERSGWSSSFSSGKSETREGARTGSIMEEVEIHAQDAFVARSDLRASFRWSASSLSLIDPTELDLPYDSRYRDDLELDWTVCVDMMNCRKMLIPSACLTGERLANDILYSPRLGGKIFSSSGLGSGFSLAEAAVHAAAECIERHSLRLAELELNNPSGVGLRDFWFVDVETLPEAPRRIVDKYIAAGMAIRILDITSEIGVPAFWVSVFDDPFKMEASMSSDGFACHPDPEIAVTMALLEAAQTKAGLIAGGREDYSLQARSLGRHERPRTMVPASQVFWFCNDRPLRSFGLTCGFVSGDILEEFEWIVDRLRAAGLKHLLLADYTIDRIRPAYAVRVVIPGLETTNPLFTGARARATLIRDLMPRPLVRHLG